MTAAEHAAVVRRSVRPPAQILRANSVLHDLTYAFASLAWLEEQAARAEAAEVERDEANLSAEDSFVYMQEAIGKAEAAEVRVAQLETAIREAIDHVPNTSQPFAQEDILRAVLAADRETET